MESQKGYYDVKITVEGKANHHRVYACSDYDAAVKVRTATGFMPVSDEDVVFISPYAAYPSLGCRDRIAA